MRKNIRRRHEAHRRAQAVCEANPGVIDASDGSKTMAAALDASVGEVDRLLGDQGQALNVRYVVVHDDYYHADELAALEARLPQFQSWLTLEYSEPDARVYAIHRP